MGSYLESVKLSLKMEQDLMGKQRMVDFREYLRPNMEVLLKEALIFKLQLAQIVQKSIQMEMSLWV